MSGEPLYFLVVIGLFFVPKVLQRLHLPSAITCVALGAALGMGMGLFHGDTTVPLLATFGIVSLFLFAGLEVDFHELRNGWPITVGHVVLQLGLVILTAWALDLLFAMPLRASLIAALAIMTPSTGFILDSLPRFGLSSDQQFWVKTKAIATELQALLALFLVVQSTSAQDLALASAALLAMVLLLPVVFQVFASRILPHAPRSEFAFLVILALVCAYVTRQLGVYYLVGAFVVGVTAARLRKRIPELGAERVLIAIELFASFFIPFYFFKAGLHLEAELFTLRSVAIGLALVATTVPLRVGLVAAYRRVMLGEPWRDAGRVACALVPTLVFTLVLADIARTRFGLPGDLFGALVIFALVNTTLPGLLLRTPPPDFVAPEAPRMEGSHART